MSVFSYDNYKKILKQMKIINKIYNFKSIDDFVKNGYILRHDVDFDIEKAYIMSNIEKEMNVTSTYFMLVTSDLYNVLSYNNKNMIKSMSLNGFEIGLHFDPVIYGDVNLNHMQKQVEKECSIIEDIIGETLQTVSLHNPSIHNQYPVFKGYNNAYSKEFFNPDLYLSDSCKDFRGKEIFEFIKKGKDDLLQVLFHPIHFSEKGGTYIENFNELIENRINKFDKNMYANKTYKIEIGESTLLSHFFKSIAEEVLKHEKKF